MAMQIEVGGMKIEQRADTWLHNAKIAKFMQAVADGAVNLTTAGVAAAQHMLANDHKADTKTPPSQEQRASK
jgi:hypothetical protein